ncbi:PREDICTED: protein U2-like [Fragaria vesca subsp. vesca]
MASTRISSHHVLLQKLNLLKEVDAGTDSENEDDGNSYNVVDAGTGSEDEDDTEFCEFHGERELKYPSAPPYAPTRIRLKLHTVYNIPKKDCVKCKEEKLAKQKRKKSKEPNIVTMSKNGHPRVAPLHESGKHQFLVYY